jgi:hypothetical protein
MSAGYSITVNYTWSKCFDFGGGYSEAPEAGAIAYGPCDFNRNQVANIQHIVQFPFGKGRKFLANASKPLDYLIGGWALNGVWQVQSGQPYTPSYESCGSDEDVGTCRPNLVGKVGKGSRAGPPGAPGYWFTTTGGVALASGQTIGPWQRPMPGEIGNDPWDSLTGPGFFETDLSLFKNFTVTERVKGQFRFEAFNAFNHVNLGQPNSTVDSPTAGQITSTFFPGGTAGMRNLQFAIRFDF